jgi:hypothetical protein
MKKNSTQKRKIIKSFMAAQAAQRTKELLF